MKKVLCAISGGVDSSVVADFLNKRKDFCVQGAFMKLFSNEKSEEMEKKARLVADKIDIPFYVFDFQKEFKKEIIDYFVKSYKEGRTPNPCVVCNKKMKFGLFLAKAQDLQMDFIATGHYALKMKNEKYEIYRGKDKGKDQSYFLWQLNQKQLEKILFPIGQYKKKEIKNKAKEIELAGLVSQESQDICFIEDEVRSFLKERLKENPGDIVDLKGNVLGEHKGLWFYTIGQRKGIKLSGGPFYVLKKDGEKNQLIVTKNKKKLIKKEIKLRDVNWISGKEPSLPLDIKTQIRYGGKAFDSVLLKEQNNYLIKSEIGSKSISPGQSAVFYKGEKVLGGGIIC